MFEKVNPAHPDKIADRIAGALVDIAYSMENDPRIAVEVLIGHNECNIIAESSVDIKHQDVERVVRRITQLPDIDVRFKCVPQDSHLAGNQEGAIRCGDNGIFCGMPITEEQKVLTHIASEMYSMSGGADGKYILDIKDNTLIICQSNYEPEEEEIKQVTNLLTGYDVKKPIINPLGYWTGGVNVDSGATNRKLGSDMGDAVTGGGLHGKDLSKADVSVNIWAHIVSQDIKKPIRIKCAIGDESVEGVPFADIVHIARHYIFMLGGFEKFAEWGLIR